MKKKETQSLYEGMYILSATLSDEARQKALNKITHSITEKGGKIHKIYPQGRHRLSYEILKKRDGYYYMIFFSIAPSLIKEIWKDYHLHEDLLRFFTTKAQSVPETLELKLSKT